MCQQLPWMQGACPKAHNLSMPVSQASVEHSEVGATNVQRVEIPRLMPAQQDGASLHQERASLSKVV